MIALVAVLGGCGGSGEGLDQNGRPLAPGGGATSPLAADFASIQDHVFTPICTVCHAGAGAPQGLRLDAANAYALLVGIPSTEAASVLRVAPGDPDASYLVQKLEGHASVGARMPFGGPYLDGATIAVIREWITRGAKPGAPPPAAKGIAPPATAVVPGVGDVLAVPPARVVVEFASGVADAPLVALGARLERVDPVAADAPPQAVSVDAELPAANPRALVVTPRAPLAPGRYRLIAPGAGGAALVLTEFDVEVKP